MSDNDAKIKEMARTIEKALEQVARAAREYDERREELEAARALRDEAIRAATQVGATYRTVARVAGVTNGRVAQLLSDREDTAA